MGLSFSFKEITYQITGIKEGYKVNIKAIYYDERFPDNIECDLFDYRIAYEIMTKNVLPATMCEIPKSTLDLYEALRKIAKNFQIKTI